MTCARQFLMRSHAGQIALLMSVCFCAWRWERLLIVSPGVVIFSRRSAGFRR